MMLLKFIFVFGLLLTITNAECPATTDPQKVVDCLDHVASALYGALTRDVNALCRVASNVSKCLTDEISECLIIELGKSALDRVQGFVENCCPNKNDPKCPLRSGFLNMQRCFAADSLVTLTNGQQKRIIELESGDTILAYDDKTKEIVSTEVLTMLDIQPHEYALFKQLTTVSGRQLSLTSSHLLPTNTHGYVMAKDIRVGMNIYVVDDNGLLTTETILNVIDVVKQGYIAPLTQQGTLIVNNVAASCYATINNHQLAHAAVAPMRWWYGLFGQSKSSDQTVGIHWFPKMLFEMTAFLMPSIIKN